MANRGKRVYHGRRASPIVWLIALAVLIAAVVLVVALTTNAICFLTS